MLVKDFILSCDEDAVIDIIMSRGNFKREKIIAALESIRRTDHVVDESQHIDAEICIYDCEESLDVTVMHDGDDEKYSFVCSSWHDVLGWQIDNKTISKIGAERLAAEIIWEMTWFAGTAERMEYYNCRDNGDGDEYRFNDENGRWECIGHEYADKADMTVKDVILAASKYEITAIWQHKYFPKNNEGKLIKAVDLILEKIRNTDAELNSMAMICVEHSGNEAGTFDANLYDNESNSICPNAYYRLAKLLGCQVPARNIERYGIMKIAAELMWICTLQRSFDIEYYLEQIHDGEEVDTFERSEIGDFNFDPLYNSELDEDEEFINEVWKILDIKDGSMKKGVFWLIDDELLCFPFDANSTVGVAKSGDTYNHKKLWDHVKQKGCNKPYSYYPRGRMEITNKGNLRAYMNSNIDEEKYLRELMTAFGLEKEPEIIYDHSRHYRCYLDKYWREE